MSKRDGCRRWYCPDCKYINHTCRAEDNERPYVCEDCGMDDNEAENQDCPGKEG